MAIAKVKSRKASKIITHGKTFYNHRWIVLTDNDEIEHFKRDKNFTVVDVSVDEVAAPPKVKDDFLKFKEPVVEHYKYHDLMSMKKTALQEIAYDMGAPVPDDAKKRHLVQAILDKQVVSDEIPS